TSRIGELAMGYDRLTAARITLLVDCAEPPALPVSHHGHASTLAFEMSSGRHPIVVNCGAGQKFSAVWERKCRATVSHNTVAIEKISSSRIAPSGVVSKTFGERLLDTPANVTRSRKADQQGNWLLATHDGYASDYGLIHQRRIFLSPDGREFRGQDSLTATSDKERKIFKNAIAAVPSLGVAYVAHFHLHPDVKTKLSDDNKSVALQLPNKEIWVFRHEGGLLTLESSVFLDQWRHKPRATKQIVVSSRVLDYSDRITWIFKRVKDKER
ncbi:MAG: heparinase II/III-family protein, partial [Rhodobacteraceae bacterium]|nr:heparinase II/III-family protein [Paracoccaceae bacterium]